MTKVSAERWVDVGSEEEIRNQERSVVFAGGYDILIFSLQDSLVAIQAECPHAQGELAEGELMQDQGERVIQCPIHHYRYSLADGHSTNSPHYDARIYPVKAEGGRILVGIPG